MNIGDEIYFQVGGNPSCITAGRILVALSTELAVSDPQGIVQWITTDWVVTTPQG